MITVIKNDQAWFISSFYFFIDFLIWWRNFITSCKLCGKHTKFFHIFKMFWIIFRIQSLKIVQQGIPDGTRLPDEDNCQKFTLCDGGYGLTLTCRSSDPYFYRCNSTCVNDISFCQIIDCPGVSVALSNLHEFHRLEKWQKLWLKAGTEPG